LNTINACACYAESCTNITHVLLARDSI